MTDLIVGVIWGICIVLVVLPPKYDPAIRWKERNEHKRKSK